MAAILEAGALTVGREGAPLLAGVSLRLGPGQALLLQGPNGAGKTTLLRCLAGFLPPLSGEIRGEEPAFAGHLDGVKAQLSVEENLGFWAKVHGAGEIAPALSAFELAPLRRRLARTLSAGQKRRLGLARLLLTGRRLWLLDEPTVSLDAASVALFARAVRAHLEGGGAALIATHIDPGLSAPVLDIGQFRPRPSGQTAGGIAPAAGAQDGPGRAVEAGAAGAQDGAGREPAAPGADDSRAGTEASSQRSAAGRKAPPADPWGDGW